MEIPGARLIGLAQARPLLEPHLDPDVIELDLMFEEPDSYGGIALAPGGTLIAGDLALEWENATLNGSKLRGLLVDGALTVDGDITSENWDGGPFLVVTGQTKVRHIIKRGAPIVFLGPLQASGSVYCEHNHGVFRAHGGMRAQALINDDHLWELREPVEGIVFDTRADDPRAFLLERFYYEEDDGEVFLIDDAAAAMIADIRAGVPIFRPDAPRRAP